LQGKVLSLAWHPEKEGELAFGTSDGRVGICNASNASKEPLVMRQFHKHSVYRVAWGPPIHKKDQECPLEKWYLYACDENLSVVYLDGGKTVCPLKTIIRASNPQIKEDIRHKDIAWKPDRSLLALGLEDGSIQLLTAPNLQCIHTLLSHKKMIFFLSWHPSSTAVESQEKRQNWLASTSMDQQIHVYDLSPLLGKGLFVKVHFDLNFILLNFFACNIVCISAWCIKQLFIVQIRASFSTKFKIIGLSWGPKSFINVVSILPEKLARL